MTNFVNGPDGEVLRALPPPQKKNNNNNNKAKLSGVVGLPSEHFRKLF